MIRELNRVSVICSSVLHKITIVALRANIDENAVVVFIRFPQCVTKIPTSRPLYNGYIQPTCSSSFSVAYVGFICVQHLFSPLVFADNVHMFLLLPIRLLTALRLGSNRLPLPFAVCAPFSSVQFFSRPTSRCFQGDR